MSNPIRYFIDGGAAAAIVATIAGYLPAIAALAAIIWYAVQIWESKTVQKWVRLARAKGRMKRRQFRIAQAIVAQAGTSRQLKTAVVAAQRAVEKPVAPTPQPPTA